MLRHLITSTFLLGCLLVPSGYAQKTDKTDQPRKANDRKVNDPQKAMIPAYLQSVDLTKDQESKIRDIVRKHSSKAQQKWHQFYAAHWDAVQLEAALRATCSHDEHKGSGEPRSEEKVREPKSKQPQGSSEKSKSNKGTDSKKTTKKQMRDDADDIIVMRMLIRRPNGQVREVVLFQNPDEEKAGEQPAFLKDYKNRLQRAWKRVRQLHNELVQMQSQRMVAIEQVLTKEQCEKCRGTGKTQPEGSKRKRDRAREGGK